jgi:hypothetical protein
MINFKLSGEPYEYDDSTLSVKEARVIKKNTGMGLVSWARGLADGDPDAMVALVWLAKTRAGEAIRWQDLDDLDLASIQLGGGDDEDPPVPTTPTSSRGGRTRKPSSTTT